MEKYELIEIVGDEFVVDMFLRGEISLNELAEEIGSSNADLVEDYKKGSL